MDEKSLVLRGLSARSVGEWGHNKSDPARCVNTMCAGPCRTGLEFD